MPLRARDVMDTQFYTLLPQTTIAEAVRKFKQASEEQNQRVYGMMVLDEDGQLAGIIAMYDILLLLRPRNIHLWEEMPDVDTGGYIDEVCQRARSMLVGDIMTSNVISIPPEVHLLTIVDIMVKNHIRRIPVVENGKVLGIVYISKVLFHLMERLLAS